MRDVNGAVQSFQRNVLGGSRLLALIGKRCSGVALARQVHGSGKNILLNRGLLLGC